MALQVDGLLRLAYCSNGLNQKEQSIDIFRQSVELAERVAKAAPDDLAHRERLALCHLNQGAALFGVKRTSEAMVHFQEATKIYESIDPSTLPGVTVRLADSLMNEGLIFSDQNPAQAEKSFQEAERLLLSIPT